MKKKSKLLFTKEFLRKLKRLDKQNQIRILKQIKVLETKPLSGKRLIGRLHGLFSYRVGEYRVIYEVALNKVIIRTVGHRRGVYEK